MNSTERISPPRGPRPLLLAIPLALLGILLVATTVQAVMVSRLHTTLAQFDTGSFDRTGLLDIPAMGIDSVQLLPIGLTGEWFERTPLPVALADLAAATNGDFMYVIGGIDDSQNGRTEVYRNTLNYSGTIGAWTPVTPMPVALYGSSAAVRRGAGPTSTLYVVGGVLETKASTDTVYRATLDNATGNIIGAWQLDANHLPVPMHYAAAVVHGGTLYVIGGYSAPNPLATVYRASIQSDGSLGPFQTTESMPKGLFDGHAVVYDGSSQDTVYYIGGRNRVTSTFEVFFADLQATGTLTPWQLSQGNLPLHVYAHSGTLINGGEIIVTGGVANALYPGQDISSTIKAALVDPDNPSFRLYDWCMGVPPPTCTIGAWQTGGLLPEPRAFHETVSGHGWVYVLGGKDEQVVTRDTVYAISVHGVGSLYSPYGEYLSAEMELSEFSAILHNVTWNVTLGHPGEMGLTMQFRHSPDGVAWSPWTDPIESVDGANEYEFTDLPDDVRYFQYQAVFTTSVPNASPLLDEVEVFYELDDPDLQVRKDADPLTSVNPGDPLLYYVYYTNTGEYVAAGSVITEELPQNTTYAGTGWERVGTTRQYTYDLGSVHGGDSGYVEFAVDVNVAIPPGVTEIVNNVEIDYPPFVDRVGATIVDPVPADNEYTFPLPLNVAALSVGKSADPPADSLVEPGQLITYTIEYANTGTRDQTNAVIVDHYDPSGSYQVVQTIPPPSSGNNSWQVPQLPVGASGEITVTVQVVTTTLPNHWPITNTASIDTDESSAAPSNVVTHTVIQPGVPDWVDLVIEDLTWEPANPLEGEAVSFRATIANWGGLAADQMFWVELYVKPAPSTPPSRPADHQWGFCLGAVCNRYGHAQDIASLASLATTSADFEELLTGAEALPAGDYDVYVQVDTAYGFPGDNPWWGMYAEDYETNNLWHDTLTIEPVEQPWDGHLYLPIVYKRASH